MRSFVNPCCEFVRRSTIRCGTNALRLLLGTVLTACLSMLAFSTGFPATGPTAVLDSMKAELSRSMETLKQQPVPAYFLSYEITDTNHYADVVTEARRQRRIIEEAAADWIVVRNRVGQFETKNGRNYRQ
jgi:hypothetical protein